MRFVHDGRCTFVLIYCEILRLTMQDLVCKKYANSGVRSRPPTKLNAAHAQQAEVADPFEFGGLCDDDLEETRPTIVEGLQALVSVKQRGLKNTSINEVFIMHDFRCITS